MIVKKAYLRITGKLLLFYGGWASLLVISMVLPLPAPSDQAYLLLGKSFLYFLPMPLAMTIRLLVWRKRMRNGKEEADFVACLSRCKHDLQSSSYFIQLLFIGLLLVTVLVTLVYRSSAAIWLMGLTIQVFIVAVVHFTEDYYTTNLLRETGRD